MEKEFIDHIKDLGKNLLFLVIPLIIIWGVFLYYSRFLITYLLNLFGFELTDLITISPFEGLNSMLSVSFTLAFLVMLPIILVTLIRFARDVFSKRVYNKTINVIGFSYLLVLAGVWFSVKIFCKLVFNSMSQYSIVNPAWTLESVLSFATKSSIMFALFFQIVLIIPFLVKLELLEIKWLTNKITRLSIFISFFIISAVITPQDLLSTFLMTAPLYICYELGIIISKLIKREVKQW